MVDPGDLWRGGPGRARPSPLGRGTASRRTPEPAAPSAGPSEWRAPAANPATEDGGLFGGPRQSLSTGGFGGLRDHIHFDTRNMTGAFTIRSHAGGRNIDIQRYVPPLIYRRREDDPPDQGVGDLGAFPVCIAPCNNPLVSLQAQSISTYDPDAAEEEAVIDPEFARRRFVYDGDGGGLRMEAPLPLGPHAAGEAAAPAAAAADGGGRGDIMVPAQQVQELFTSASFRARAALIPHTAWPLARLAVALLACAATFAVWTSWTPAFQTAA